MRYVLATHYIQGSVIRYFTCIKPGPTNASFLKPNKLDRGVGFMEVLHKRYVTMDAPLEAPNQVRTEEKRRRPAGLGASESIG